MSFNREDNETLTPLHLRCCLRATGKARSVLAVTIALVSIEIFCATARAANSSNQPLILLAREQVASLLAINSAGIHLMPLSEVLFLPSTAEDSVPVSLLNPFDRVPIKSSGVFQPGPRSLLDALKILDADIEIKAPDLSDAQKKAADEASHLLYVDSFHIIKTDAYKKYLDYQNRYQDLVERLKKAGANERSGLILEQQSILSDWNIDGQRSKIAAAISTAQQLSADKVKSLKESWETQITPEGVGDYSKLWDQVASLSDWTALSVTTSPAQLQGSLLRAGDSAAQLKIEKACAGLAQISMKVRVFKIPRRAFEHPFLQSSNWQNKKSYVLSDGNPTDTDAELVPRYVTALILVKGLELRFSSISDWREVSSALQTYKYVELGGLPLRTDQGIAPYTSPNYVASATPFLIDVVIREVGKVPNPDPSDNWPARW